MTHRPLTFLFTDLENSTPLWERFPDAVPVLVDMPNSGKPAKLPEHTLVIKDFEELNQNFS